MTGAQIFHEMLLEEGVEVMFGVPGGVLLPIFDVLHPDYQGAAQPARP